MNWGYSVGRKVAILLMFLLFAAGAADHVLAGGLEDAWQRGGLLVGVKSDFPPFGYLDDSGVHQGFDVEVSRYLAKALFDDTGERLQLVPVTSGSRIPFLYSGWIDVLVASMTITEERKRVLEFSDPYFVAGSMLLVSAESTIKGLQDLVGKKVAVLQGAIQEKDLAHIAPQAVLVGFGSLRDAVEALKSRHVDAVCTDDAVIFYLAQKDQTLRAVGSPFNPHPYAIAVRKGDLEFVKWINKQLNKMREDGTYDKLQQKYLEGKGSVLPKP